MEDAETMDEAEEIARKIPFAVVGSDNVVVTPDGREVRGRAYPWGVIEVDNEDHCDFVKLRQMLVRTYMEELREYTNDILYENWRTEKLLSMGVAQDSSVFKEIKYVLLDLSASIPDSFFSRQPCFAHARRTCAPRCQTGQDGSRDEDGIPAEGAREGSQVEAIRGGALRETPGDEGVIGEATIGSRREEAEDRERQAIDARERDGKRQFTFCAAIAND